MSDLTDAINAVTSLTSEYSITRDEMANILTGPEDGGNAADGYFPVTLPDGVSTVLVPSVRKIEAIANASAAVAGDRTNAAVNAADAASAAAIGRYYPDTATGLAATTNGQAFFVAGAGASTLSLVKNVSGAAVDQSFSLYTKAGIDAAVDALATTLQAASTGYPIGTVGTLVTGSPLFASTYAFFTPVTIAGNITSVHLFSMLADGATGTVRVRRFNKSGSLTSLSTAGKSMTQVGSDLILNITGGGLKTFNISSFPVNVNEFIGFYCNANTIAVTAAPGSGFVQANATGNFSNWTVNSANNQVDRQLQVSFTVSYPYVTTTKLQTVETVATANARAITAQASAIGSNASKIEATKAAIATDQAKGNLPRVSQTRLLSTAGTWTPVYELGLPVSTSADASVLVTVDGTDASNKAARVSKRIEVSLTNTSWRDNAAATLLADPGTVTRSKALGSTAFDFSYQFNASASGSLVLQVAATAGTITAVTAMGTLAYTSGGSTVARAPMALAPQRLGTITIDNTATGAARIEAGYVVSADLPWKAGLAYDFSNLRIFAADAITPLSFYLPETRLQQGSSATVYIRLPALPTSRITLVYDAGASTPLSDGAAVFDTFENFKTLDAYRWTVAQGTNSYVGVQPRLTSDFVTIIPTALGQSVCWTPVGWVVGETRPGVEDGALRLFGFDGVQKLGPVSTGNHAYNISYVPETNYLIVNQVNATDGGLKWIHRLSDLALVGKLPNIGNTAHMGPSKLLTWGTTTLIEYAVDWSTFAVTAGKVWAYSEGVNEINSNTAQGWAYNKCDGCLYYQGNNNSSGNNFIHRYSFDQATSTVNKTASWRGLITGVDGKSTKSEGEGLTIDDAGNLYRAHQEGVVMTLFRDRFSTDQGGELLARTPPATSGVAASITATTGLTGASKIIFGMRTMHRPSSIDSAPYSPAFGFVSTDSQSSIYIDRTSNSQANTANVVITRVAGGTNVTSGTITMPSALPNPNTYEFRWDGTSATVMQGDSVLATYTTNVPTLDKASTLTPIVTNRRNNDAGSISVVQFIATSRLVPAGQAEPVVTVAGTTT
jgi:hypothetical protein